MALTGVLRAGFVQLRVFGMDEALAHYVDYIGLELVEKADDGRAYLRGYDEFNRHSIVLREADSPGVDVMAFKVVGDADLDAFEKRIENFGLAVDHVATGEQPSVGRRIGFTLPSGHCIELYAEIARSDNGPIIENPDVWRDDPRGMRALGFDHCLLYGPNITKVTRFLGVVT
jgi:catechol 2,3-dioxygenase|tara:strand:- start:762 stop:1280 length:519 start_codon:yes stop_codon:yes gene_type:complete